LLLAVFGILQTHLRIGRAGRPLKTSRRAQRVAF
jgi:hypothetical protein